MLTDNNQIFKNWFVIIHRHPTKVSAQIIQCRIFELNELSITLSILLMYFKLIQLTLHLLNKASSCTQLLFNGS